VDIGSADGRARIEAEWADGQTRLRLVRAGDPEDLAPMDGHALSGLLAELDDLRSIADHLPLPVWQVSPQGDVTWANSAYLAIAVGETGDGQALPRLVRDAVSVAAPGAGALALTPPGGGRAVNYRWQSHATSGGLVFAAWPEGSGTSALGGFLDTLANTFAQLSVGLAVFDKGKRLTLFNPAFSDLTGLQAAFLVSRPTIEQLLDRLRDDRMAPEPKDYRAWRRALSDIDPQDGNGAHTELWPLADGRTFRTTVRSQEGGALAFLLEDVTQVLAVSRRLRAELEISQAVIDTLEDAVAVFSPDGILTVSNRAYAALWGADPLAHVGDDLTLVDAVEHWQRCCVPTPAWGDARAFALDLASRPDWTVEVRTRDDRSLICRFRQIAGRATLASFSERPPLPANGGIKRLGAQSA
jgi:PAS domain-containing protein